MRPTNSRARAIAKAAPRPSMLPWVALALALSALAAHAQSNSANPPATRDAPSPGTQGLSAQGSGPQMAVPQQPGANAGKSVIAPPNVDPGIGTVRPAPDASRMPIIPPPGAPGGNPAVVPK